MEESSTIQAFIEEGRVKGMVEEARKIILRLGRIRFGEAGDAVESRNGAQLESRWLAIDKAEKEQHWKRVKELEGDPQVVVAVRPGKADRQEGR